jgi:hypothetical protein
MKKIIWVASYPKSGNTWVRAIISSLLYSSKGNFNFNLLKLIELFEKKTRFNFVEDLNINDFKKLNNIDCISRYWKICQERIVFDQSINPVFNIFKTHSANLAINSNGFTDKNLTGAIIYIVRDPREMLISYSNHMGKNISESIDAITDNSRLLTPNKNLATTIMSSWDTHYESWKRADVPKIIIKYEDLVNQSKDQISNISKFLCRVLKIDETKLDYKIHNVFTSTTISKFRKHEKINGFDEASKNSNFFGEAKINSWKNKLTLEEIYRIEHRFNKTLKELGYL